MEIGTGEYEVLKEAKEAAEVAKRIGKKLKPPSPRASDRDVELWRWFIVTVVTGTAVIVILEVALAWGVLPIFAGFAYASDVKTAKSEILQTRIEQLEWRIFDLQVKRCEAQRKGENPQVFTVQIEELGKKYWYLTNREVKIPDCKYLE